MDGGLGDFFCDHFLWYILRIMPLVPTNQIAGLKRQPHRYRRIAKGGACTKYVGFAKNVPNRKLKEKRRKKGRKKDSSSR